MKKYKELIFDNIAIDDIEMLIPIMKNAFDEDTRMHLGKDSGGPNGYDNGELLRKFILDDKYISYKIIKNKKVIGVIVITINNDKQENYLENLFLDVNVESKGIGTIVWGFIESEYPNTKIWRSETPIYSRRNHNFYINKSGFHIVKIKKPKDLENGSYLLEKVMYNN